MRIIFTLCIIFLSAHEQSSFAKDNILRLEIIDPYVEMHTGPGRGYPIFYVIEQGETVEVLTRRPDWYELRTQNGQIGWATATQISRTLEPTGEPVDLPSVSYGDYLKNSWRVGFTVGQFSSGDLQGSDTFTFTLGYRPFSFLSVELEGGKIYGTDIQGDYGNFNFVIEPFSRWKVSPYLLIGGGVMAIDSQPELTPVEIGNSNFYNIALGANYYAGRNFIINGGYRWLSVDAEDETVGLQKWHIGFNAFF